MQYPKCFYPSFHAYNWPWRGKSYYEDDWNTLELLLESSPETYGPCVVFENGKKVLYLQVLRASYGTLVAALIWYQKFCNDLEGIGFVFNPYDPCVANRIVKGSQQTVRFHVDDLKSSHLSPRVNDLFLVWLNKLYGSHGEVTATRGKVQP